ncbi:hypothetical protein JTB14_035821 [Gonioctena quinquepunctata]|nr:hypothetical protein JTB14_035821 [Gonioctena quinquepunctata]
MISRTAQQIYVVYLVENDGEVEILGVVESENGKKAKIRGMVESENGEDTEILGMVERERECGEAQFHSYTMVDDLSDSELMDSDTKDLDIKILKAGSIPRTKLPQQYYIVLRLYQWKLLRRCSRYNNEILP